MKKSILAIGTFVLLLTSCSSSQLALKDLRNLSDRIDREGYSYNINDWRDAADDYYKIDKKIARYTSEGKYSRAEEQEIGRLQGDCVKGFAKGAGQNVAGKVSSAINIIKGIIDGFKK